MRVYHDVLDNEVDHFVEGFRSVVTLSGLTRVVFEWRRRRPSNEFAVTLSRVISANGEQAEQLLLDLDDGQRRERIAAD